MFNFFKSKPVYGIEITDGDNKYWYHKKGIVQEFKSMRAACETLGNIKWNICCDFLEVKKFDC